MLSVFYTLYDEEVISEESFYQWRDSNDRTTGKGNALVSVSQFYKFLAVENAAEDAAENVTENGAENGVENAG